MISKPRTSCQSNIWRAADGGLPTSLLLVYVTSHGARDLIAARLDELGYRLGDDWLAVG